MKKKYDVGYFFFLIISSFNQKYFHLNTSVPFYFVYKQKNGPEEYQCWFSVKKIKNIEKYTKYRKIIPLYRFMFVFTFLQRWIEI